MIELPGVNFRQDMQGIPFFVLVSRPAGSHDVQQKWTHTHTHMLCPLVPLKWNIWPGRSSLNTGVAMPGRLIAIFWVIFNLGGRVWHEVRVSDVLPETSQAVRVQAVPFLALGALQHRDPTTDNTGRKVGRVLMVQSL